MATTTRVCDMDSINRTIARHIGHTLATPERLAELVAEKERLLDRLTIVFMSDDYASRERLQNEYHSLSRIINENQQQLEAAA